MPKAVEIRVGGAILDRSYKCDTVETNLKIIGLSEMSQSLSFICLKSLNSDCDGKPQCIDFQDRTLPLEFVL